MHSLSPEFWLSVAIYIITGICAVVSVAYQIGKIRGDYVTKDQMSEAVTKRNGQIEKVYTRFDDHKTFIESTFVRKDICCEMHRQTKEELKRIDDDAKLFRHDIRNAITAVTCNIAELKDDMRNYFMGKIPKND